MQTNGSLNSKVKQHEATIKQKEATIASLKGPTTLPAPPSKAAGADAPDAAVSHPSEGVALPDLDESGSSSSSLECVICLEKRISHCLVPCGHYIL